VAYRAAPNPEPREDIWPIEGPERVHRFAVPVSASTAEGSSRHQFPFCGTTVSARPLSRAGIAFLRVHRHEVAQDKWKFTKAGGDWFCFAGLWRPMPLGGEAFTLLTTEPGPDVAPIHNRQMVILEPSDWSAWLEQTGNEGDLLRALPAGFLNAEQVR
jgi:hypothetical protein